MLIKVAVGTTLSSAEKPILSLRCIMQIYKPDFAWESLTQILGYMV